MFSKQHSIIGTVSFILALPIFVTCLPTSLEERQEVNWNFAEKSRKVFLDLQVSSETDSETNPADEETEDDKPGCNQIPGKDTCTVVKPKMCCEVICFSGAHEYTCGAWTPSCSTNLCPSNKISRASKRRIIPTAGFDTKYN